MEGPGFPALSTFETEIKMSIEQVPTPTPAPTPTPTPTAERSVNELETLLPVPKTITIKGEEIPVGLIKVGRVAAVVKALQPFAHLLPKAGDKPGRKNIDFFTIVLNHTDDAINLCVELTSRDKAWVEDLDIAELVELLSAIVERNLDFFIQRVLPSVSEATAKLIRAFYGLAASKSGHSASSV
mgnify:CR=1 FL=1